VSLSHSNTFRPFEHHTDHHEDPVSRAAVLVMRRVPLAYQCILDLATRGEPDDRRFSVAELPKGEFSVQRKPAERDQAGHLLSVFLTPGAEPPEDGVAVDVTTLRNARHDGFIRHGSELIVVVEAKRWNQPDYEQARLPGRMASATQAQCDLSAGPSSSIGGSACRRMGHAENRTPRRLLGVAGRQRADQSGARCRSPCVSRFC
jgi:hypothetical protein